MTIRPRALAIATIAALAPRGPRNTLGSPRHAIDPVADGVTVMTQYRPGVPSIGNLQPTK